MKILDYFKRVPTWTPEEVRAFLDDHSEDEYNLVDVRTLKEYEEDGHLPGAQLIPVGELADHVSELDPKKTTIVY
ncbi:MAG TPA: rhodanese-like domain-containing protein [Syntrophorhabdales bacterium]|nr:rhodanese-like domain-containing protein [Syntrophorhabdales bacterium]